LIHSAFHPLFDYLSCQIPSKETPVEEQGSGSSPINDDPIDVGNNPVVDTHTANSPTHHTPDGKEVVCPFLLQ